MIHRLSRRDRVALLVGAICLMLFGLVNFILLPLLDGNKKLARSIAAREKAVVEMQNMRDQYQKLASQGEGLRKQLAERPASFSLYSFLEQKAATTEVKQNIAYMKPSQTLEDGTLRQLLVEMKLQAVSLKQLVNFLEQIESPENIVALRRISIQENSQSASTLDVVMQVVSIDQGLAETGT